MYRKTKVAVIGVGYLGNYHTEKYSKLPSVELVAVVDINQSRAEKIASRYNTQYYTDYRTILDKVDAVSIAVPTEAHYEIAKACLQAGLDVLVEKPMTETVWQAERLVDLAAKHNQVFQVGHLERFNPAIQYASGIVKEPVFIECHRLNSFVDRGTEVDIVLDLMIHDLDIILQFVRSPLIKIDAVGVPVLSSTIDIANVRLRFQNGCVANLTASRISVHPMRKMRIFQTDAYVSVDYQKSDVEIYRKISKSKNDLPEIVAEPQTFKSHDALEAEVDSFIRSVQTREEPVVSGKSGLKALKLAHQIVQQIKKGRKTYDAGVTQNISRSLGLEI